MERRRGVVNIFHILWVCCVISMTEIHYSNASFTGVTQKILGGPLDGLIGVFGDFNMDKKTDVFAITDNGHKIELYMKDGNSSYLLHIQQSATISRTEDTITSVASGDFDGDFQIDVLITTKPNSDPLSVNVPTKAFVYWGNITAMEYGPPSLVTDQLSDQPLVMDCDGDMIPDIFGADMTGKKMFWKTMINDSRKFVEEPLLGRESQHLVVPNSNAFLDLTGNFAADLFMVTSSNGSSDVTFEIWSYMAGTDDELNTWQFNKGYSPPTKPQIAHLGVSTFADMNADSFLDHILPVCFNDNCTKGAIYVKFLGPMDSPWTPMFNLTQLDYDKKTWGFVPPSEHLTDFTVLPLVARTGDFNLDTFNDVLVLVQSGVKGSFQRRIVLLENVGDSLQPAWVTDPTNDIISPVLATFIDIQRTGQLDIIIVNQTSGGNQHDYDIYLMDNILAIDAYFVQMEILSGLCKTNCPLSSSIPYGVAQPGPVVRYETTSSIGQPQMTGGSQLSQSAYFSLQLPYVLLGLGQNPNFVDTLMVGVPGPTQEGTQNKRVHEWTSVIPNSQLIVIPDPLDKPNDWISKILIIPGQSVLLTGIILICTCVVLTLTAAFLHLKERKDDEKEKRQEAHRFHFDAM
ncbi:T-cell immunomodulatory protein [Strongylocentrotus purpuratus]|uniref:T-cell immunomodulatory protein TIP C2 domain-containing protein n=1 Tax=Strongylocentrotus purpuratus TaxID=7668 RepID=A0A7M7RES9_STRPU|nr:T-cell immunomodulatory protein [Strongylocentrotus purpuratus]